MSRVLVDTSVWVDHFRRPNASLVSLLERDRVLISPLMLGEIACGTPPRRAQTLQDLASLQAVQQASIPDLIAFIDREGLAGRGCGLVDLMLLASTLLTPGAQLWSLDARLAALAAHRGVAFDPRGA